MAEEKKETDTLIVKGIEKEIKEALRNLAEQTGKTMSDLMREAIRIYLSAREAGSKIVKSATSAIKEELEDVITIKNIGEVSLSKEDLVSFEKKVALINIDKLELLEDVDTETFKNKIEKIVNVKELIVPKSIPKAILLPKCSYVNKIIQR